MRAWLVVLERRGVIRALLVMLLSLLVGEAASVFGEPALFNYMLSFVGVPLVYIGIRFFVVHFYEEDIGPLIESMRREVRELEAAQTSDKRGALTMKDKP